MNFHQNRPLMGYLATSRVEWPEVLKKSGASVE